MGQTGQGFFNRGRIILGQATRIRARIRDRLVLFVESLRNLERAARRITKTSITLTLQTGQIVQQRRRLRRGFLFLQLDHTRLTATTPFNGVRQLHHPQP